MPFPYVSPADFKREIPFSQADFPEIETVTEWDDLLDEALKAASEQVEGYTGEGVSWRASGDTVPFVVRACVIRLARHRLASIDEDGLSSEQSASGARYDYRPPQELRNEVTEMLDEAGYRDSAPSFSIPDLK